MSIINGIDYDNLAHISKTHNVPFHILCERAEKGELLQVDEDPFEWVAYSMAATLLSVRYCTLTDRLNSPEKSIEYWGIEWKSRSLVDHKAKQGCGVLFKRADINKIKTIKDSAHISLRAALKVFEAMALGKF